ncbi:Gamma-glutamyltranspeptidase 1 [Mactra antiquata]
MSYQDQRVRLLSEEEGSGFTSYDDDELQAAAKLRRKRQRFRACLWISCGVILIMLFGVGLYFGTSTNGMYHNDQCNPADLNSAAGCIPSRMGKYKHAAVSSDVTQCSQIGRDALKKGGNAVDAALASLLCMGLADPQSMGIGGGFFMTIYNRTSKTSISIDARETAPGQATEDMFYKNGTSPSTGGLAIGVPGEIRGYETAFKYCKLPWKQLFQPAIDMAINGFKVPKSLEEALVDFVQSYPNENITEKFPQFVKLYSNPKTGKWLKEGDILQLPELGETLKLIATEGADAFYNGSLTKKILDELNAAKSIITQADLLNYTTRTEPALEYTFRGNDKIFVPTSPSGGAVLIFILNILDGYGLTKDDFNSKEKKILTYHRIIEAFKFAYAKRTDMADEIYWPSVKQLIANLKSREYGDEIRSKIWDNQTHSVEYYGPTFHDRYTTSTAHLSVVDEGGNAVSVTSTINGRFGAKVFGSQTGIFYNNEMDDFATSDKPNEFGVYPSPANKIKPGKRPLSSMCPAVLTHKDGTVKLVIGAAGGSRITTATAYAAVHNLWLNENIEQSIDALRLHHQLLPPDISYEEGFDQDIINGLVAKGHNVTQTSVGKSIVQGITKDSEYLYAESDVRKHGLPAGY